VTNPETTSVIGHCQCKYVNVNVCKQCKQVQVRIMTAQIPE